MQDQIAADEDDDNRSELRILSQSWGDGMLRCLVGINHVAIMRDNCSVPILDLARMDYRRAVNVARRFRRIRLHSFAIWCLAYSGMHRFAGCDVLAIIRLPAPLIAMHCNQGSPQTYTQSFDSTHARNGFLRHRLRHFQFGSCDTGQRRHAPDRT